MADLCPGCGRPRCDCTPTDVRRQLVADRAELSDRAATYTARANDAARLIKECARLAGNASREDIRDKCHAWLGAWQQAGEEP